MKSFTDYYFNYGFNSTVEKTAMKKKEDEGMGAGAKAALGLGGAAALGGLGYGAHAGYLGDAAQGVAEQGMDYGRDAAEYAGDKGGEVADYIKNLVSQAGHGARDTSVDALEALKGLGQKGGHLFHDAKSGMGLTSGLEDAADMGKEYITEPAGNALNAAKEAIIRGNPFR